MSVTVQKQKKKNKLLEMQRLRKHKTIQVHVQNINENGWKVITIRSYATGTLNALWERFGRSKKYYCANWYLSSPFHLLLCWNEEHTKMHLESFGTHQAWLDQKTGCIHVEYADENYDGNIKDWIKQHVRVCQHLRVGPPMTDATIYGAEGSFIHIPGSFRQCLDCGMPLDPDTCKDVPITFKLPNIKVMK